MPKDSIDVISAIKRPFTDIKHLIIGLILFNIPIVNIFTPAYFFRCIRGTYLGHTFLPDWNDVKDLLKDWLEMLMIGLLFISIPFLLFLVFFQSISILFNKIGQVYQETTLANFSSNILEIFSLIISDKLFLVLVLIFFVSLYFMIIGFLMQNDKKAKKFDYKAIFKKGLSLKFFAAFVLIMISSMIVGSFISLIPYVGEGISNFLMGVISFTLYAQVYLTLGK